MLYTFNTLYDERYFPPLLYHSKIFWLCMMQFWSQHWSVLVAKLGKVGMLITLRACARGKVIKFVIHSVAKKKLRLRELALSRTSEHIRSFEDTPILLTCTCYWTDSLPLAAISAVFLLSGQLCQPFYLRPSVTPTTYMPRVDLYYIHDSCPRPAINFA